jgi:hypothetical protein
VFFFLSLHQFLILPLKCTTTESPPSSPCERCTKMGLSCEYVSVATQCAQSRSSPTGRGKALNLPRISTSPPTVTRPRNQFPEYCDNSSNAISNYSQQRNRALKAEPYSDLGIRLLAPSPFEFRRDIPDDVSDSKDTNSRPSYLSRSGPTTALHLPPLLDQKYYNKSNQYWSNLTVENTQHMPYPLDIYPPYVYFAPRLQTALNSFPGRIFPVRPFSMACPTLNGRSTGAARIYFERNWTLLAFSVIHNNIQFYGLLTSPVPRRCSFAHRNAPRRADLRRLILRFHPYFKYACIDLHLSTNG